MCRMWRRNLSDFQITSGSISACHTETCRQKESGRGFRTTEGSGAGACGVCGGAFKKTAGAKPESSLRNKGKESVRRCPAGKMRPGRDGSLAKWTGDFRNTASDPGGHTRTGGKYNYPMYGVPKKGRHFRKGYPTKRVHEMV